MSEERTQWFHTRTPPVRAGWYEVRYSFAHPYRTHMQWWNGGHWLFRSDSIYSTDLNTHGGYWRGLAQEPKR
jgi:hypothetical protein